ncbi:MAG TPA: hypothetical protein PLW55_04395, partial [Leptospiraceae bacterium]|nr:hypothetical protein [Leptospiraceae bacterium]
KKRGRTGPGSPLSVETEGGYSGVEDTVPTFSSTVSSEHTAGGEGKSSSPLLLVGLGGVVAVVLIFFLFRGKNHDQSPAPSSQSAEISAPASVGTETTREYTTKQGQTLTSIAESELKDKTRAKEILELNIQNIAKLKAMPENKGLEATNLKNLGVDKPFGANARKLLLPAK